MDRSNKLWLAGGVVVIAAFAVMLLRDRGRVGRVITFEVDGAPFVTIFGLRNKDSASHVQASVITWDVAGGQQRCSIGFMFGGFLPYGAAGRHLWVDRSSTSWSEIALWDLATCEERFDADHFRAQTRENLNFGTFRQRPVDPATGRLFLDFGFALDDDGSVVTPPVDTFVMPTPTPRERASCRSRQHTPACDASPFCAGEVDGRVEIAAEGELGAAGFGPTFAGPRLLGSPGSSAPCVRVLTGGPAPEVLVRHDGASGPDGTSWPPGVARIDAAGVVRWNAPATEVALDGEVIAVQRGADDRLWIVAADDGWQLTGGYTLTIVEIAGTDGAVLGRVALP